MVSNPPPVLLIGDRQKSEPLLCIPNQHLPCFGEPPAFDCNSPHVYVSYFEGPCGDQWVFTFDQRTGKGELRGGDVGWDSVYAVGDGKTDDLILSAEEQLWLQACWRAAAGT